MHRGASFARPIFQLRFRILATSLRHSRHSSRTCPVRGIFKNSKLSRSWFDQFFISLSNFPHQVCFQLRQFLFLFFSGDNFLICCCSFTSRFHLEFPSALFCRISLSLFNDRNVSLSIAEVSEFLHLNIFVESDSSLSLDVLALSSIQCDLLRTNSPWQLGFPRCWNSPQNPRPK